MKSSLQAATGPNGAALERPRRPRRVPMKNNTLFMPLNTVWLVFAPLAPARKVRGAANRRVGPAPAR
jgi:hypothetical protein